MPNGSQAYTCRQADKWMDTWADTKKLQGTFCVCANKPTKNVCKLHTIPANNFKMYF